MALPRIKPPSTGKLIPVMKLESSLTKNATACEISSGSPMRGTLWYLTESLIVFATSTFDSIAARSIGVRTAPGWMALTRTPYLP